MAKWLTTLLNILTNAYASLNKAITSDEKQAPAPVLPVKPPDMPPSTPTPPQQPIKTKQEQLYDIAKSLIGSHLTLNEAVPWMVGCAEAVSYVLKRFGTPGIPPKGVEGTAAMLTFLRKSKFFEEVYSYEPGLIILSPTGSGNGRARGHVGICGKKQIMSNNSETGKWGTSWSINGPANVGQNWTAYYHQYGGLPIFYFRPV